MKKFPQRVSMENKRADMRVETLIHKLRSLRIILDHDGIHSSHSITEYYGLSL